MSEFDAGIITRPKKKTKTLEEINSPNNNEEFEIVKVLKSKKKKSKVIDSDDESEYDGESDIEFDG